MNTPRFSPATQAWFDASFAMPTAAQEGAWDAIAAGRHALVVAPTGSGKTLAAFLASIDRLASEPRPAEPQRRCRVLYVSPMKALAVDVERNLRAPLAGIRHAASRLGLPPDQVPDLTVGVRSGDTPADERRRFGRTPPDILITTPESLFLILTSQARESLRGVETVIVDEVLRGDPGRQGAERVVGGTLERGTVVGVPAAVLGLPPAVLGMQPPTWFRGHLTSVRCRARGAPEPGQTRSSLSAARSRVEHRAGPFHQPGHRGSPRRERGARAG